jgi:hypothetical protein
MMLLLLGILKNQISRIGPYLPRSTNAHSSDKLTVRGIFIKYITNNTPTVAVYSVGLKSDENLRERSTYQTV